MLTEPQNKADVKGLYFPRQALLMITGTGKAGFTLKIRGKKEKVMSRTCNL